MKNIRKNFCHSKSEVGLNNFLFEFLKHFFRYYISKINAICSYAKHITTNTFWTWSQIVKSQRFNGKNILSSIEFFVVALREDISDIRKRWLHQKFLSSKSIILPSKYREGACPLDWLHVRVKMGCLIQTWLYNDLQVQMVVNICSYVISRECILRSLFNASLYSINFQFI